MSMTMSNDEVEGNKVVHVPVPTNNAFSMELVEKLRYAGDTGPEGEKKVF